MRTLFLFFILLPCWLTAQDINLEKELGQTIIEYQQKAQAASKREDWEEFTKWHNLVYETVIGETVSPVYLEDQYGELWNLGVINQPFVVHGLNGSINDSANELNAMKIAAANVIAEENATKLMTFLLMPRPVNALDSQCLANISDKIIVVFMEVTQAKDRISNDTRLLSLVNRFPITYYIRSNREIAGLKAGVSRPYPKREDVPEMKWEEAHNRNIKGLRKDVRNLLRARKIKRQ
jgi:hypothetical protein